MHKSGLGCRVGVFGHYGNRNMGDEAIIEAVIQNLRARWPGVALTGFSINAADTARRYGIPAFPIRRLADPAPPHPAAASRSPRVGAARNFLKRFSVLRKLAGAARLVVQMPRIVLGELLFLRDSYRVAREIDCFFIAGSSQFQDCFGGAWGFPYTLLKWTVLARCAGARVVFVSIGAGPIDSVWSRIMVRSALLFADYVSFRDPDSRRLIEWPGSGRNWRVYPDLAQSLPLEPFPTRDEPRAPVVGINPMAVYDRHYWHERDDGRYTRYVDQLARFASRLMQEDYPLFFFGTQPSDDAVIDDVMSRLDPGVVAAKGLPERKMQSNTANGMLAVVGAADIVVATRFHGVVLALHAGRPVLGICYHSKTRDVMRERGQETYALDLDEMGDTELSGVFAALAAHRDEESLNIRRTGDEVQALLAEQYDLVLAILGAPSVTITAVAESSPGPALP